MTNQGWDSPKNYHATAERCGDPSGALRARLVPLRGLELPFRTAGACVGAVPNRVVALSLEALATADAAQPRGIRVSKA